MTTPDAAGRDRRPADELAPDLHHRGSFAVLFVVAIGVGVSLLEADDPSWPFALAVLATAPCPVLVVPLIELGRRSNFG